MCMPLIQPQVELYFNHSFVPLLLYPPQNQPMVSRAGTAIKAALTRMGKTQGWLASEMDVSDNAVSKWIKNGQIARENIPRLARLLGLYADELLPEVVTEPTHGTEYQPRPSATTPVASEGVSQSFAMSVHIETLRQSAKVIADAFGITPADVLAAAMKEPANQRGQKPEDEEILDHGTFHGAMGPEPPEYRPVMREESHYYPSQVDPYADLKPPGESTPQKKDRRG